VKTEASETSHKAMEAAASTAAANSASPKAHSFADDRLVGVEAIAKFIDPNLSLWKAQRLLEEGHYPSWREGRIYVASKTALCERWRQMTGAASPQPPNHDRAA
jgi:hypothetical protein